jgi:hypothetical protein
MTSPFHSQRDAAAVLGTYLGAERLFIEQALDDERLSRRSWRVRLWPTRPRTSARDAQALLPEPRRTATT